MKITRRSLLQLTGLAALGIFVPACREMLRQILFSPDASSGNPPPLLENPFRSGSRRGGGTVFASRTYFGYKHKIRIDSKNLYCIDAAALGHRAGDTGSRVFFLWAEEIEGIWRELVNKRFDP